MKKVAVLGSTGSIGTQTLDVIRANSDKLKVSSLVAFSNRDKLLAQANEFCPDYTGLISQNENCLLEAVRNCDVAVVATRGIVALDAVLFCLHNGIDVALANKETLVCGGELVTKAAVKSKILPVDSEHAAIAQCLSCGKKPVKLLLTASGGPFFDMSADDLTKVTPAQALAHPNWNMGQKITVDSATMMNKSLEVLEASRLFGMSVNDIEIVVHRQSVVHSMVQFDDGSVVAQLAKPDMRLPILQALLPNGESVVERLDFAKAMSLSFCSCDFVRFPCAKLGYEVAQMPALAATAMNAANDVCVHSFLDYRIGFCDFYPIIRKTIECLQRECSLLELSVENIKKIDKLARDCAEKFVLGE